MGYIKQQVLLYKRSGADFSETAISVDDAYGIQTITGLGDKKDTFKFDIINSNNRFFSDTSTFEVGDNIKIYNWKNATTYTNDDLLIDRVIEQVPYKITSKGRILTIKGYSRMELLFNTLIYINKNIDAIVPLSLPKVITHIIDEVNQVNNIPAGSSKGIKYVYDGVDQDGNATTDDNTITKVNASGVEFTAYHNVREIYRRSIEIIKKYSSAEFTGDGTYMYWLDSERKFHWTFRSKTPGTVLIGDTPDTATMSDINIKYSKDELITALILNVGVSPSRKGNTTYAINPASITKYGAKWKYISETQGITEALMQQEEANNGSLFNLNQDRFPITYNYTTHFTASETYPENSTLNLPAATKGSPIVCTSDDQYDAVIRREAEWFGQKWGERLLNTLANPRLLVESSVSLNTDLTSGDYVPMSIPSYNISGENLRVSESQYNFWKTESGTLQDEEDAVTED